VVDEVLLHLGGENDLPGMLLKDDEQKRKDGKDADYWEVLNLAAICEEPEKDPLGRKKGEALWPENYDERALARIMDDVKSYVWNSQYQGHPQPLEGGFFQQKWFRNFRMNGDYLELLDPQNGQVYKKFERKQCRCWATVDTASKEKQQNDYTVIGVWAQTPDKDLLLLDMERAHAETTEHIPMVNRLISKWRPWLRFTAVEDKGAGTNIIDTMKKEAPGRVVPLSGKVDKVDIDKVARAWPIKNMMMVGQVYFLEGAQYRVYLEDELLWFPNGAHDDCVDVCSYAGVLGQKKHSVHVAVGES
jgi:predicted phage terminase large subunit-like protein